MKKIPSKKGHVYKTLGFACFALCVMFMGQDKILWAVVSCVAGICLVSSGKVEDSKAMIQGQTKKFLAQNPNAKEPVDDVIACADIETILNSKDFYDRGVKIVSIAPKDNEVNFVLTRDCLYDGVYSGYREPSVGIQDVCFAKGEAFEGTQRVQMDEDRMAAQGFLAGGLGVAAMNVASAREANAQGGAVVGVRTGKNRFMLSVRKDLAHVWVLIVRRDLIQKFGNPIGECHVREGRYYNAYYCQLLPAQQCMEAANKMTKLLQQAIQEKK